MLNSNECRQARGGECAHRYGQVAVLQTPYSKPPQPQGELGKLPLSGDIEWYRYQGEISDHNEACGPACVAMAIQYVGKGVVSIKEILKVIGKTEEKITNREDLENALKHWGVNFQRIMSEAPRQCPKCGVIFSKEIFPRSVDPGADLGKCPRCGAVFSLEGVPAILEAVRRGHIVIAPVAMNKFTLGPDRDGKSTDPNLNKNKYRSYDGGHFFVVKGISSDQQWIIVNDPLVFGDNKNGNYWYANREQKGKNRFYSIKEFESALQKGASLKILPSTATTPQIPAATPPSTTVSHLSSAAIDAYNRAGGSPVFGESLPLNYTTPNGVASTNTPYKAVELSRGGIYEFSRGVFVVYGAIYQKYRTIGGPRHLLGLPISNEQEGGKSPYGTTGRVSLFERGSLVWIREKNQAFLVQGAIFNKWASLGPAGVNLGFPVSDEYPYQGGVRSDFEGGYITWNAQTGAQVALKVTPPVVTPTPIPPSPPLKVFRPDPISNLFESIRKGIPPAPKLCVEAFRFLKKIHGYEDIVNPDVKDLLIKKAGAEFGVSLVAGVLLDAIVEDMDKQGYFQGDKPLGKLGIDKYVTKELLVTAKNAAFLDIKGEIIDTTFNLAESWSETIKALDRLPPEESLPSEQRKYYQNLYAAKKAIDTFRRITSPRPPVDNPPNVTSFSASASQINQGGSVTLSYSVVDDVGLKQVELWRADDTAGIPFREVKRLSISGKQYSGSFSDIPPSQGTYRYGLHVVDAAGKRNCESNSQTGSSPGVYGPRQVVVASAQPACTDGAQFVADVTIPDGTKVQPNQRFTKTWRLRNTGSCTWGSGYSLVFVGGTQMGAPSSVSVPSVSPNGTVDISVPMTVPPSSGTYQGNWQMRNSKGQPFGSQIWVKVNVASAPSINPQIQISISPSGPWGTSISGQQGVTFHIRGSGFSPNGAVQYRVRKPDGSEFPPSELRADGSGSFSYSYTSQCSSPAGAYTLWVVDKSTGKSTNTVSEMITKNPKCK
jgi:hypothetical protein